MDDGRFDKEIREKLGEYEAPGFDPAALASLHHQMAAISVTPWYSTYRTELMVGSTVFLSALLIVWSQWMMNSKSTALLEAEIQSLRNQSRTTEQLQNEFDQLNSSKPDTVTIVEYQEQPSTLYLSLLRKIDRLETSLKTNLEENDKHNELLIARLNERDAALASTSSGYTISYTPLSNRIKPKLSDKESKRAVLEEFPEPIKAEQKNLSTKTIRDLQKHYQNGIGIHLGPSLTFSRGSFDVGNSRFDFGGGILVDFIISPSLSLETGIIHTQRHNRISSEDIAQPTNFPGADPTIGELTNVDIDSWVFETPVNLKYRYPISLKSNWIFGAGYTPMLYSKQVLEYDYQFDSNQAAVLNSSLTNNQLKTYTGTLNLSLGYSTELKNTKTIETSLLYRHGLGKVGIEQTTPDFIGIRGAYWFTLK